MTPSIDEILWCPEHKMDAGDCYQLHSQDSVSNSQQSMNLQMMIDLTKAASQEHALIYVPEELLPILVLLKDLLEKEPKGMCIDYGPNCGYCHVYINDVPEGAPEHADTCPWQLGQKYLGKEETT